MATEDEDENGDNNGDKDYNDSHLDSDAPGDSFNQLTEPQSKLNACECTNGTGTAISNSSKQYGVTYYSVLVMVIMIHDDDDFLCFSCGRLPRHRHCHCRRP